MSNCFGFSTFFVCFVLFCLFQANIQESIKAPHDWWGWSTGDRWILLTKGPIMQFKSFLNMMSSYFDVNHSELNGRKVVGTGLNSVRPISLVSGNESINIFHLLFQMFNWSFIQRLSADQCTANRPILQIPQRTSPIFHNAPFRTEMCLFLFWMAQCGIWDWCIVGFVRLVCWGSTDQLRLRIRLRHDLFNAR